MSPAHIAAGPIPSPFSCSKPSMDRSTATSRRCKTTISPVQLLGQRQILRRPIYILPPPNAGKLPKKLDMSPGRLVQHCPQPQYSLPTSTPGGGKRCHKTVNLSPTGNSGDTVPRSTTLRRFVIVDDFRGGSRKHGSYRSSYRWVPGGS